MSSAFCSAASGEIVFSRDKLKSRLEARRATYRYAREDRGGTTTSSDASGDDGLFWIWYWTSSSHPAGNDTLYVGPKLPFHDEISQSLGAKTVDDPAFRANEHHSDPLNHAVDGYVTESGQGVGTFGSSPTTSESHGHTSTGHSSGGHSSGGHHGGGDGDGGGDGGGGDGGDGG